MSRAANPKAKTKAKTPKDKIGAKPRQGPRPLPLHLATQIATLVSSHAALPSLKNGSLAWSPRLRVAADQLRSALGQADGEAFDRALASEAGRRVDGFLKGIDTYRRHPYRRRLADPPVVWREGTTRLLDYSLKGARGPVLLAVPSLINRAYILDLTAQRSLMRFLAKKGFRPFLLDWDAPGAVEMKFGLDDYIAGRLSSALDVVTKRAGKPALLGYCMGGLLTLALALLRPKDVQGLALFATPWDFHQPDDSQARIVTAMKTPIEDAIKTWGGMPVDLLQACFATIDPGGIERKFRALADMGQGTARARDFVALEDWLNDGIMLAGPVARDALFGWYIENKPALGTWRVGRKTIRPERYTGPSLVLVPSRDRIVPPASALALAQALPRAETVELDTGHIGMVTGATAPKQVYARLAAWLNGIQSY
ncbi:MAG TPA: alpha/beta fold hydrolase [Magnetospirillaceae bacterium]|jgi:polyhydroxyalkanoate synthase